MKLAVIVEAVEKKAFAAAADWPGWCRGAKTPDDAIAVLLAYADRYRPIAEAAGEELPTVDLERVDIVERLTGSSGTAFGVPSQVAEADRRRVTSPVGDRLARIVDAAWQRFDAVAAAAPAELRKGPRGGGRDTAKIVGHVVEADGAYARELGLRFDAKPDDRASIAAMRAAMLDVLRRPNDGGPVADRRWTQRYAARRIAWHALDHAWEIEDRSQPA